MGNQLNKKNSSSSELSVADDKLSIKINVAERYYPLRIARKDEEKIRYAAKRINEKVQHYKQRYADRDVQDALSMSTLQFVVRLLELEQDKNVDPLVENINELDKELGDYLNSLK